MCVCASPSLLALSAIPPPPLLLKFSPSSFAGKEPLLFRASSCSLTGACSFLPEWEREYLFQQNTEKKREGSEGVGDVIKMLRVFPGCVSAMLTHVRAATVLPLRWTIETTLPVSSKEILMRHPWLQCEGKKPIGRWKRERKKTENKLEVGAHTPREYNS